MAIKKTKEKKSRDVIGTASMVLVVLLVLALYWRWALPGIITLGDWSPAVSGKAMTDLSLSIWNSDGLGNYIMQVIPFMPLIALGGFLSRIMHYNGAVIELLVFFVPLVSILIISPMYLARILGLRKIGIAASIMVFNLNTIIFQIAAVPTLALAIAVGPLVIASFIQSLQKFRFRECLLFGLMLSLQMLYDIRIAYVGVVFCFLYLVYHFIEQLSQNNHYNFPRLIRALFLMVVVVILIHSYWLIPFFTGMISNTPMVLLPTGYNAAGWVRTLSYWELLHVLGLQSPFWGKPDIINPPNAQFLFFPILAFGVFLFPLNKIKKSIFLFFGLAALIFTFLAKGSKPPFGEFYIWFFLHFPGFSMFREPGKWWSPVAISYAVLIGGLADTLINSQNIERLSIWVKKRFSLSFAFIRICLVVLAIILFFLIFPVNPLSSLYYSGIYEPYPVPKEADYLEDFLHSQPDFSRILWLPRFYRFGYFSSQHPSVSAVELGQGLFSPLLTSDPNGYNNIFSYLNQPFSAQLLRLLSVKYIIVPFAPTGQPLIYNWYGLPPEYFQRLVDNTTSVTHSVFEGKSKIYEVPNPFPYFYTSSKGSIVMGNYNDILPIVAGTKLIEERRILITPEQAPGSKKAILSSDDIILQDSGIDDLGLAFSQSYKVPFQIARQKKEQILKIKIQKTGIYEFWVDCSKMKFKSDENTSIRIKINKNAFFEINESLILNNRFGHIKFLKLGEISLKAGKHNIKIKADAADTNLPGSAVMIIVDKSERVKSEELILNAIGQSKAKIQHIFSKSANFNIE